MSDLGTTVLRGSEVLQRLADYCGRAAWFEMRDKATDARVALQHAPTEATLEGTLARLDEAYRGCLDLERAFDSVALPADAHLCARLAGEISEAATDLMEPTDRFDPEPGI